MSKENNFFLCYEAAAAIPRRWRQVLVGGVAAA